MAKLEGVKVMDMINGEITKIAYDGAEYAKVGDGFENANVGDIFTTPIEHVGMTPNAYYELIRTNSSEVRFYNDIDSCDGFNRMYGPAKVFRKISDGKPTIEERVTALENDVAVLKGGGKTQSNRDISQVKKGDKVRVVDAKVVVALEAENGSILEVTKSADSDGDFYVMDIDNEELVILKTEAHAFEILSADEAKWAKLGRKVNEYKVGDIIRYTSRTDEKYSGLFTVVNIEANRLYIDTKAHGNECEWVAIDSPSIELVVPVEKLD